jgi:hypothetical protein
MKKILVEKYKIDFHGANVERMKTPDQKIKEKQ